MFNRLYLKLAVGLTLVFILVGTLILRFTHNAMERYSQAVNQSLNASVAMYVSDELELINQGVANTEALKTLAHHAMVINPAIEIYLLDPQGHILNHNLPQDHVKQQRVDLTPIQQFLTPGASLPLLGDDPGKSDGKNIFSVHPVQRHGQLQGYVYVVLEGKKQALLESTVFQNQVFQISAITVAGCLVFGILSALLLFARFSRRLSRLSQRVEKFYNNNLAPTEESEHTRAGDELEHLETAFNAMHQRIQQQLQQIQQSDEMRRELIANISHDLRTPLTNMLGYIETLMIKQQQLDESQQQQYLKVTRKHGQQLQRLIADLFELAKLENKAIKPQIEAFSIAELTFDVIQDFSIRAEQKQVVLKVTGDLEQATVHADISLIERVLVNLVDNALRHTPAGGEVLFNICRQHSGIRVTISDSGCGISDEDLPHIFDRFFHTKDNSDENLKSTGLGLAIVKRILDLHLSPIRVTSRPHYGTSFEFVLAP